MHAFASNFRDVRTNAGRECRSGSTVTHVSGMVSCLIREHGDSVAGQAALLGEPKESLAVNVLVALEHAEGSVSGGRTAPVLSKNRNDGWQ